MSSTSAHTLCHEDADRILEQAGAMGYLAAGFTDLELSDRDRAHLRQFAEAGNAGEMHWFGRHLALRSNPAKVFPGAQGALVLATYYRDQQAEAELARARYPVSRYALGRDYHRLLRKKGQRLLNWIQSEIEQPIQGRVCVDSAPVPEKILARKAGIGWQGKHTNVIHPKAGSYFFLSVILLDCMVPPGPPPTDLCGKCRLCLDACPTQALAEVDDHYEIDAGRCLSYLNIEHPGAWPDELQPLHAQRVFGCDICQEVCPYNRNRTARDLDTTESGFRLRPIMRAFMHNGGTTLAEQGEELLEGSALRRAGRDKLRQTLHYIETKHIEKKTGDDG